MQKTIAPRAANILLILALFLWSAASYAEPFAAPIAYEKMHRTVNVDARGRYTETVELVSRIANEYGADRFGRHSFDHKITQESLKVVAAYNILPDGKTVRLAPDWIKKIIPKTKMVAILMMTTPRLSLSRGLWLAVACIANVS